MVMKYLLAFAAVASLFKPDYIQAKQIESLDSIPNPVIWADYPDPDVIRVGDDYYMVATTMQMMPGCPVLHSRDLVNWETVSYVFDHLDDTPRYQLDGGTVYGKGQWATSIRYNNGNFYVLFSPNDQPYKSYIYSAKSASGPWELRSRSNHFHDASMLFDDDGKVYVFHQAGDIRLTELNPDLSGVKEGGINQIIISPDEDSKGLHEGSRAVKYKGKYYLLVVNWPKGRNRRQLCYRSDKITGPYEKMVILEDNFQDFPFAGQGCIVDGKDGNWWAMIFQDRGAIGRVPTLSSVKWVDNWPMVGVNGDGKIDPVIYYHKEHSSKPTLVSLSDEFESDTLHYAWEWNHVPDNDFWSLSKRPGYLRLRTNDKAVNNIYEARNTLTQRMEGPRCWGVVKLDLSGMAEGDVAGFGNFNGQSQLMSIHNTKAGKTLICQNQQVNFENPGKKVSSVDTENLDSIMLKNDVIYLRIDADFRNGKDKGRCYYSLDGKNWTRFGKQFKMKYDWSRLFVGQRFALYCYATEHPGKGYIDIDYFHYGKGVFGENTVGLKDAISSDFLIGVALNEMQSSGAIPQVNNAVKKNFNCIVAENCMKPDAIHPAEKEYRFVKADEFVSYAQANNQQVIGHCLIWHQQTPKWFFEDENGNQISREKLIERMREHIHTIVRRYKGQILGWDVVNEAINDDGSFRKSKWYEIIGPEYIELAFKFAHEADSDVELYYNDFSMSQPEKRKAVCSLIRGLKNKGCRIDAVGMQSHLGLDYPDLRQYEKSIEAFANEGVNVMISELDLNVLPAPANFGGAEISDRFGYSEAMNPYKDGLTSDASEAIDKRWLDLFKIYKKHADKISRVTLWGFCDSDSWLNNWPIKGRTAYPLLFDRQMTVKPVVTNIINVFISKN